MDIIYKMYSYMTLYAYLELGNNRMYVEKLIYNT